MTSYQARNWTGKMRSADSGIREVITDPVRSGRMSSEKATARVVIGLTLAVFIFIISILVSDLSALYQNGKNISRLTRKIENLESSISDLHTELDMGTVYYTALSANGQDAPVVRISVP